MLTLFGERDDHCLLTIQAAEEKNCSLCDVFWGCDLD